jgi:adenylosuccinate synthase
VARQGLRVGDVLAPNFREKYRSLVQKHEATLAYYGYTGYDLPAAEKDFFEAIDFLKEFQLVDSEYLINQSIAAHETILAEGAQGSLLDIDFGSYPFVTSSNTMTAGACTGLGVAPRQIGEVYGIFKAYCTRVGGGPFPTELLDAEGEKLRRVGHEFGSTTGRPRRCGWLDLPALKYAIMINGATQLIMMKADVLNSFPTIKVCTHYRLPDGELTEQLPFDLLTTEVTPVYREFEGWNTDVAYATSFEQLPGPLLAYIDFLEAQLNLPITMLSTGPDRIATLQRETLAK